MFAKNWDYTGDWQERVKRRMSKKQRRVKGNVKRLIGKYAWQEGIPSNYELRIFTDEGFSREEMQTIIAWLNSYFHHVLKQDVHIILEEQKEEDSEGDIYIARFNSESSPDELDKIFNNAIRSFDFDIEEKSNK